MTVSERLQKRFMDALQGGDFVLLEMEMGADFAENEEDRTVVMVCIQEGTMLQPIARLVDAPPVALANVGEELGSIELPVGKPERLKN